MNALWLQWQEKYAALSRREQAIVAAALVLGGAVLLFNFGLDPQLAAARKASREAVQARTDVQPLKAQLEVLKKGIDPDAANRARLVQIRQQLVGNGERLAKFEAGMVPPKAMPGFLQGLMARNNSVQLIGLQTLPPTLVGVPAAVPEKKVDPAVDAAAKALTALPLPTAPKVATPKATPKAEGIFQHGVELRLAGSYNDLLNYLADLEAMPQKVMWQSVSLTVEKYPRNVLTLRLFTLSLDPDWMVV